MLQQTILNHGLSATAIGEYIIYSFLAVVLLMVLFRVPRIMDRYLTGEFFMYLIFGVTLVVIFLMVNTILFEMLDFIIEKQVPFPIFMQILFYQLPAYAVMALPMATLFATLIAITRMSKDSEIDVMRTSGIGVWRIMIPMLVAGAIVSSFAWLMFQKVVPWSNNKSATLWRQFYVSDVMSKPMADVFFKGKKGRMFYINTVDPGQDSVHGVLVFDTRDDTYPRITTAPYGTWREGNLILMDGMIHHLKNNGAMDYEVSFKRIVINIERHMEEIFGEQKSPQEMTLDELKDKIKLFRESGIDTKRWETDMHFKMAVPVASFILVLMGVPLSISTGRSGMMVGIVTAVLLVILYWVMTIITTALGYQGVLAPVLAAWSQNIVFFIIGMILIFFTRK